MAQSCSNSSGCWVVRTRYLASTFEHSLCNPTCIAILFEYDFRYTNAPHWASRRNTARRRPSWYRRRRLRYSHLTMPRPRTHCRYRDQLVRASCVRVESDRDSRISEILIQPVGWAEASRRWLQKPYSQRLCVTALIDAVKRGEMSRRAAARRYEISRSGGDQMA